MPAVGQSPILEASPSQARSCSWTDGSATGQEIRKDLHFRVSCGCGNKGWPRRAGVGGAGIRERARAGQAGTDSVYHFLPFQGSELWPLASGHTAFLKPEEQGSEGRGSGGVVLRGVALRGVATEHMPCQPLPASRELCPNIRQLLPSITGHVYEPGSMKSFLPVFRE